MTPAPAPPQRGAGSFFLRARTGKGIGSWGNVGARRFRTGSLDFACEHRARAEELGWQLNLSRSEINRRLGLMTQYDALVHVVRGMVVGDPNRFILTTGQGSGRFALGSRSTSVRHSGGDFIISACRLDSCRGDDRTDEDALASQPVGVTVKFGRLPSAQTRTTKFADLAVVEQLHTWFAERLSPAEDPSSFRDRQP